MGQALCCFEPSSSCYTPSSNRNDGAQGSRPHRVANPAPRNVSLIRLNYATIALTAVRFPHPTVVPSVKNAAPAPSSWQRVVDSDNQQAGNGERQVQEEGKMERVITTEQALAAGNIDLFEACSLLTGTNCTTRQSGEGTTAETVGNGNRQWAVGSGRDLSGDCNSSISSGSKTPWNVPMTGDEDKDEASGRLSVVRRVLTKMIRRMKARTTGSRNERNEGRDGGPRRSMFFGNRRC